MIGGVTGRMLPHLSGVPHLHVNRPLLTNGAWNADTSIVSRFFEVELWQINVRDFESKLTSTPWAKKMINFSFLSNRCVFYSFCHWFSIKFLKRYLVCGFVYICDVLALNRRHTPFLALLGDRSAYSYFLNRRFGKPDLSYLPDKS